MGHPGLTHRRMLRVDRIDTQMCGRMRLTLFGPAIEIPLRD